MVFEHTRNWIKMYWHGVLKQVKRMAVKIWSNNKSSTPWAFFHVFGFFRLTIKGFFPILQNCWLFHKNGLEIFYLSTYKTRRLVFCFKDFLRKNHNHVIIIKSYKAIPIHLPLTAIQDNWFIPRTNILSDSWKNAKNRTCHLLMFYECQKGALNC